jgi:hypothetical protein
MRKFSVNELVSPILKNDLIILVKWSSQFLEILEFSQQPQNSLIDFNNDI